MRNTEATLNEVYDELERARGKFPAFNSAHEGYAVILEELDELWAEARTKACNPFRLREEAIQVAAMAVRFVEDVCDPVVHHTDDISLSAVRSTASEGDDT